MEKYKPEKIEPKWQKIWEEEKIFEAEDFSKKPKFYGLIEFPYPSGDGLHVGHLRSYTALDIICRKKRMEGYSVLYPIGFDSFGLPTENYAIKKKIKPQSITQKNISNFSRQLKSAGFSFDWSRVFSTSDPKYYKWTQWIFLELFKKGLAYKAKKTINWCPSCKIGLANEEVVNGKCERCGTPVIQKEKEQWLLKITRYADRLINDLKYVDYLEKIKKQQVEWIGRSEGAEIKFSVPNLEITIKVFTTRPDTIFGATFLVLAPMHPLVGLLCKPKNKKGNIKNIEEIQEYINKSHYLTLERDKREKTGVEIKGIKAINPATKKEIPIYVADYVNMDYGTGAIMAVPAHDERDYEFAQKYNLPVIQVIKPPEILPHSIDGAAGIWGKEEMDLKFKCYSGKGKNINSGFLNSLETDKAIQKIIAWLERNHLGKRAVNYHLRDWIFSRQRYWGEPIPLVFCPKCKEKIERGDYQKGEFSQGELLNPGWIAVSEKNLPVELPEIDDFMPTDQGDSPLAKAKSWINATCPKCGGAAIRETDVMPNWAGSNWYYLRYCDAQNKKVLADSDKLRYWMPVDWYNGGMEHTTLHLLYSRFIYKFLYDIGAVPKECGSEPYKKRTSHGMILGEGGVKMSKSKGNVVNPDDYIKEYGADTVRMYEMFMGPFDQAIPWDGKGVIGIYRFLNRVWEIGEKIKDKKEKIKNNEALEIKGGSEISENQRRKNNISANQHLERKLHQTIKKVSEDIEAMKFNTAVSQLMILLNEIEKGKDVPLEVFQTFLILLSPFAPHIAEELWQKLGHKESILREKWPEYDPKLVEEEAFTLVVQINGKVREQIGTRKGISKEEAKELALKSPKIQKWLKGKEIKKFIFIKDKLINFVVR